MLIIIESESRFHPRVAQTDISVMFALLNPQDLLLCFIHYRTAGSGKKFRATSAPGDVLI